MKSRPPRPGKCVAQIPAEPVLAFRDPNEMKLAGDIVCVIARLRIANFDRPRIIHASESIETVASSARQGVSARLAVYTM